MSDALTVFVPEPESEMTVIDTDVQSMAPNEYVFALTMLADVMLPEVEQPHMRLEAFLEAHLESIVSPTGPHESILLYKKDSAVIDVFNQFNSRLKKMFDHYKESNPLISFAPKVKTDENKEVSVPLKQKSLVEPPHP